MPPSLGAGLMQIVQRRTGQLELTSRLKADGAIRTGQGNDISVLDNRFPPEFGKAKEKVSNAAGLVVGRGPMIGGAVDELLVLRADPPLLSRLFAAGERRQQIGAVFYDRAGALVGPGRHGPRRLPAADTARQHFRFMSR